MAFVNRYQNFSELAATERENFDYRIELAHRGSDVTVLAIHGGKIETSTSAIARAIAGSDFNLYLFEGLKEAGNFRDLHLSSTDFDEPQALELVTQSRVCVAIHGFKERAHNWVVVGGLHARLRQEIFARLQATQMLEQDVENPIGRLPGVDPSNIVNRSLEGGVQLEISYRLRRWLGLNPQHLATFAEAVRNGIRDS